MTIRILSDSLINRIAAGEVIVRPSSVVKELVENSMDAGASRILVEISNASRDIRVRDDGYGISSEDASLALVRHATSKLKEFEDLWDLQTRGFRGEALASIAAVARISILTRHVGEDIGSRMTAEGDSPPQIESAGAPQGTDIRVRDLFFNTPARLKFMKSPASELQQCISIVLRQALIRPDIGFTMKGARNETIIDVPAGQPWNERISALLGTGVLENLIPVDRRSEDIEVRGFVLAPAYNRKDRRQQFFFVNGRPITSRTLSAVLSEAYKGLMMVQRFPAAVLNVVLPSGAVDVNVHPTKEEVRFRQESVVSGQLYRGVVDALRGNITVPSIDLQQNEVLQPILRDGIFASSAQSAHIPERNEGKQQFLRLDTDSVQSPVDFRKYTAQQVNYESAQPGQNPHCDVQSVSTEQSSCIAASNDKIQKELTKISGNSITSLIDNHGAYPQPLGQVGLCYIVASLGNDMLLIDQHAAHERLLYQKFSKNSREQTVNSQNLLVPISLDIPVAATAYMTEIILALSSYGIGIEHFGGTTYIINSIPADLPNLDVASVVTDLIDEYESSGRADDLEELRDRIVTRMACRAAIKAGQPLTEDQMSALLRELVQADMSFTCPHGRPTMIRLTLDQLDKQFKRKL